MNAEKIFSKPVVMTIAAVICCVLWGSAFPAIKVGYESFGIGNESGSQILFAGLRFTLAGVFVLVCTSIAERRLLIPKKRDVAPIVLLSFVQTSLHYAFFYLGLSITTGVKASVLAATIVFFSLIFACFVFRTEKFSAGKFIGVLIGFCGVIIVNLGGDGWGFNLGDGFVLIAAAFGALSSVLMKIFGKDRDPVLLSGWQFFIGGLVLVALGLIMGGRIPQWSTRGFFILIWLAFVSAAAYSLWGILLKYNPVSRVTVFNFLDPVCGFILSALLLKEDFNVLFCLLALALVSGGIVISHLLGARGERKIKEMQTVEQTSAESDQENSGGEP